MRFLQLMEFRSTADDAVAEIQRFKDLMGNETTIKRATVCVDRDDPGLIVQLIEFDSYEEAMSNSEHETTQDEAAKIEESSGGVTFRNLDVGHVLAICSAAPGSSATQRPVLVDTESLRGPNDSPSCHQSHSNHTSRLTG